MTYVYNMKYRLFLLLIVSVLCSCKDSTPQLDSLSLLEYGLPISINAPEGVEVTVDDLGVWKDVTVKDSLDFNLQIIASQSTTFDKAKIVSERLAEVKSGLYFSKIIEEYEDGFIFEKKIDDDNINYDFRFIKLNGDQEYIFQTGLLGTFSEEAVRKMYNAVK